MKIETDAGMISSDLPRPQLGRTPVPNGGMQYRYRNEPVARFTPADFIAHADDLLFMFHVANINFGVRQQRGH
mgnify:CR=1 FL=1